MATITPIAYFTGATTPSGYPRFGNLLVGTIAQDYTLNPEGLQWWASADQDTSYVIGHENIQGNQPNPLGIQPTYVGFWKTQLKTTPSFIAEVEQISQRDGDPQTFTGGTQAKEWLNNNGYWTSYSEYIVSAGRTTTGGFTVGTVIDKDMGGPSNRSYPSGTVPSGSPTINADSWSDWGDDIFDSWGYYYLYDPAQDNYLGLSFNTKNQADGTFSTQVFTFNSRTFTITQGYPVQGIFKFEIRCNDDQPFVFGEGGNMGSDGSTANQDLTYNYTLDGVNLTLWYNHNYQVGNPTEQFYSYFVPFLVEENNTKTYTDTLIGSDDLYLYSVECTHGLTVYHSKTNDVKEWVVYDLEFGE
jgi:hypothetical protein